MVAEPDNPQLNGWPGDALIGGRVGSVRMSRGLSRVALAGLVGVPARTDQAL